MKQIPGQIDIFVFVGIDMEKPKRRRRRKQNRSHLRDAWEQYGIGKERYLVLKEYCQRRENLNMVSKTAYDTNAMIAENIYQSVTKNLSYEGIEFWNGQRIPCGRTDFYGWRRNFYYRLDEKLKQEGKENES